MNALTINRTERPGIRCQRVILMLSLLWMLVPISAGGASAVQSPPGLHVIITQPRQGAVIHNNQGNVGVCIAREPGKIVQKGWHYAVLLDGKILPYAWSQRCFTVEGVYRGRHTMSVLVLNRRGKPVAISPAIHFVLWQASRLFRR